MTSTPARPLPRTSEVASAGRWSEARASSLLVGVIIATAVLTPAFTISARLPDIRVDQLLTVPALVLLLRHRRWRAWFSASEWRSLHGLIGVGFVALALATLTSIAYASLVLEDQVSLRDGYEVAKLGMYWVLFRFGLLTAVEHQGKHAALSALLGAASVSALFALLQYFDAGGVNRSISSWWAPSHHLTGLERDARAFGTFANPNHFGAAMAITAVLGALVCSGRERALPRGFMIAATMLAVLGVVLSGSRGALGLLIIGAVAALGMVLLHRSVPLTGVAVITAAFLASVVLVQAFPRGREDYLTRLAGILDPANDSSFRLRWERWRSALGFRGWSYPPMAHSFPQPTGSPEAPWEVLGRDSRRTQDVFRLWELVQAYHERTGEYPPGPSLDGLLGEPLPADPLDGLPYRYERTVSGFTVATRIEDPANPYYPLFAVGEVRNYLRNASLEEPDGEGAALFRALSGTGYRRADEARFIGLVGITFRGNPDNPAKRAAVYQQRHFGRPGGMPFTASAWVKLPAPVQGEVSLYVNVLYTDGTRQDPFTRVAADSSQVGVWQRLALAFTPDATRTIDFIGVYLLSDHFIGEAYADGFELVDGGVPVRFTGLGEAPAASLGLDAGSRFRRSPVFGVGPGKADGGGTVDNEYLLVAARHGVVGLIAYLALWLAVFGAAVYRLWRDRSYVAAALAGVVVGLLAFNLVAGSLYQLQLMGLFWPVAGAVLAAREAR
jgi:O-antigen ligase